MASTNLKEKLQRQLRYEINNKIRQLEVRMFTNAQAIPEAADIFITSSGYDINALLKLKLNKSSQQENLDIIYKCNQNVVKLKLIKKLMNNKNIFCIFKVIIDNKYTDIQLQQLDGLLNPSEQECEARLTTSAGQYAMAV